MTVLDASALLALINEEPGGDLVADVLDGAVLCTVNLAEVVGKLVDAGRDVGQLRGLLAGAGVVVEPLTESDAELAGALRTLARGRTLSLGDRCCLALTLRSDPPTVVTADRAWSEIDLPLTVRLIR